MSHTPHELAQEFPEHTETISQLKQSNNHFKAVFDEYHKINRAVHRAETNVEPVDALAEVEMRKRRGILKDELYHMIVDAD